MYDAASGTDKSGAEAVRWGERCFYPPVSDCVRAATTEFTTHRRTGEKLLGKNFGRKSEERAETGARNVLIEGDV